MHQAKLGLFKAVLIPVCLVFYANFRPFSDGSLVFITTTSPFTVVNLFTPDDLPSGTNSYTVPMYNVFSQETPPAIGDVSNLTSTLAAN